MTPRASTRRAAACGMILSLACAASLSGQSNGLDEAMRAFFDATSPKDVEKAAARVIATGASYDDIADRLARGRTYDASVARGESMIRMIGPGGLMLPATLSVPRDYDPTKRYPLRVFLHGGVMRPMPEEGRGAPRRRLESLDPSITVYPTGSADAPWWSATQVDVIDRLVQRLRRTYNIDENRVHLMGVSDGGTGAYYFGLVHATPWSAIFPFNGHLRVLSNPSTGVDGGLFATNLVNTPAYVINGGVDPLYPVSAVQPYLAMLAGAGVPIDFHPQMQAGHDVSWWPEQRAAADAFERGHPRDPLPDMVSWATSRADRFNRFAWLVIDTLDAKAPSSDLPQHNDYEQLPIYDFGMRIDSRRDEGRRVIDVIAKTDAAAMGLKKNDVIVEMDGRPIGVADDIGRAFEAHRVPGPMTFRVQRGNETVTLSVQFPPSLTPTRLQLFEPRGSAGRVDLVRRGNTIDCRTSGVGSFTLLLSPAQFDFEKPIEVIVNGKPAFSQRVTRDPATLLRWAGKDQDRTMLFGAAVQIQVPR